MSDTGEQGCVYSFINIVVKPIAIFVCAIVFLIGFVFGIDEDPRKTWHDFWHTTPAEKDLKRKEMERIRSNQTTLENLKIRTKVGLLYTYLVIYLPIVWIVNGGWVILLGLAFIIFFGWLSHKLRGPPEE